MKRLVEIDILKGIAIIAVVLYHFGVMPQGYLGVDLFLVVNGYFITKGLMKGVQEGTFSYWSFMTKRLVRLWPLILLLGAISLGVGYFTMLPDDYENLAQSVVASNVFANNILGCITTGNYWDIGNSFKPLMHLWYVGIIMQMYVVYPVMLLLFRKCSKNNGIGTGVAVLSLVSLIACFLPMFTTAQKFYYLPFRFYEMGLGGLIALYGQQLTSKLKFSVPQVGLFLLAVTILLTDFNWIDSTCKVLIMSVIGGYLLASISKQTQSEQSDVITNAIAVLGKASYSLFIWHQFFYAFYIYIFNSSPSTMELFMLFALSILIGMLSYRYIEQPLAKVRETKPMVRLGVACLLCFGLTTALSLKVYADAGVMRDIPELDVYKDNVHRGMHAEYCDRIYKYERPFENNGKTKVYVVGNSFARDMANILLESEYADSIDLSYKFISNKMKSIEDLEQEKCNEADLVLILASATPSHLIDKVADRIKTDNVWFIGTKSFGGNNGNFYNKRRDSGYYDLRTEMEHRVTQSYYIEKAQFGERYIDMVLPVADNNLKVRVFSNEGKYISQDCRHLTQAGAKYYAKILDIRRYIRQL